MNSKNLEVFENADLKMAAVDALDQLMLETPIYKISVTKICEVAGMSRATFYRNFKDKFQIVQWFLKFIHSNSLNEIGRTLSWYEGYYAGELVIANRRTFFHNAARSKDYNSLDNFAPRYRREVLFDTITNWYGAQINDYLRFLVRATVEMEIHMFPMWHYGKFDCSLEDVCAWAVECVPKPLFEYLNNPLASPSETSARMRQAQMQSGLDSKPGASL